MTSNSPYDVPEDEQRVDIRDAVVTVNRADIEAALRALLADLDYDLHKAIESDEETGEDGYPAVAEQMFDNLRDRATDS